MLCELERETVYSEEGGVDLKLVIPIWLRIFQLKKITGFDCYDLNDHGRIEIISPRTLDNIMKWPMPLGACPRSIKLFNYRTTIQRLLCITFMTSQSQLWRYHWGIVMSSGPWLLRRCFKRGFGDHRKQPIYEFNWIVISIEIQLIKLQIEWLK